MIQILYLHVSLILLVLIIKLLDIIGEIRRWSLITKMIIFIIITIFYFSMILYVFVSNA
uniref:Uncharacterized protein n=1 Tax=Myoviridae sp. ctuim2 TaxID=2827717 RepID=A0A8S5SD37_9CAUD|nr:MAG TPA: hypothetical protein [Myoviridae sp. ctuim2]